MMQKRIAFALSATLVASVASAQGTWSAPVQVSSVNTTSQEYYPNISGDGLTLRMGSSRTDVPGSPGGWDIYETTRATRTSPWGPVTRSPGGINGSTNDLSPHSLSLDLVMYAANSQAGGTGGHDIYRFTRASVAAPWSAGTNVGAPNTTTTDYGVSVTDDELYMLLTNGNSLVESSRTSTAMPWPAATPVAPLNGFGTPRDTNMSYDGLTVYYSTSAAPGGVGGYDIVVSRRPFRSSPWGAPVVVANVNSTSTERSPSISHDGRELFFSSNQPGTGGQDVWVSKFTGLSSANLPTIGGPVVFYLTNATQATDGYQLALSFSANTGIPIPGVGTVPLDADNLFFLTTSNAVPAVFVAFRGVLDSNGEAAAQLNIPAVPGLVGLPFHSAFVTFNPAGISYISNGLQLGIHQ